MSLHCGRQLYLGVKVSEDPNGLYLAGEPQGYRFEEQSDLPIRSSHYAPGSPPFQRLVEPIISTGIYNVEDQKLEPNEDM